MDQALEKSEEEGNIVWPLSFLAGKALAPSCDINMKYNCACEECRCAEAPELDLQSASLQLHVFTSRADEIHNSLIEGVIDGQSLTASLPSFLFTCQPFFNFLESTARNTTNETSPLPESKHSQLLDLSEILANRLENLVLTFTNNGLLPLDETEPNSISHFHIGQCELGPMRVTIFRYCQPMPYLGQVNTGLYKCMRWNVDRMEATTQQVQDGVEMEIDCTEYYFLCFEDVHTLPEEDSESFSYGSVRVWSIGQWIQVFPETNDCNEWILCRIPEGIYLKRVILGSEEPSCRNATDCLLQLLQLDQKSSSQ